MIKEDLKEKESFDGLNICLLDNELLIKGNKRDLVELADTIMKVASSNLKNDHIHLDELTIIDENSSIKNLIIEKEEK